MNPPFQFAAALHLIAQRGRPPLSFLNELMTWGRNAFRATPGIFAPNNNPADAYAAIKPFLGTYTGNDAKGNRLYMWDGILHRTAAMLVLMLVHAGRESSWTWNEADDKSARKDRPKTGLETGIFQVSFDSEFLGHAALKEFAEANDIETVDNFLPTMKENHTLAMDYYVRLVRVSIEWAGPLIRHGEDSVYPYLNRDILHEFMGMLK